MVLAFAAIGVRLFDLQARDQPHLVSLGRRSARPDVTLPAERGSIFDRNGDDLAVSVPQTTIVADPRVIKDPVGVRGEARADRQVDQATLEQRLSNRTSAFAYVARKVDDDVTRQVRKARPHRHLVSGPSRSGSIPSARSPGRSSGSWAPTTTGSAGSSRTTRRRCAGKPGERAGRARPAGQRASRAASARCRPRSGARTSCSPSTSRSSGTPSRSLTQQVAAMPTPRAAWRSSSTCSTGDILAMATVDGATRPAPGGAAPSTEQQRAGHRRVRAGVDEQGRHHGRRDRGRAGARPTPCRRRRPERSTSAAPTTRTSTRTRRR